MVTNKIKSLLSLRGLVFADFARKLGIKNQSLHTKATTNAYKIKDLIALAELTDTQLAFIDKNGKPIIEFNIDDLAEE